ncbi:ABC transporter substrate-binding protein [Pseudonocardia sp. GCM10023141]|uniref:ABC transporter substrate-binding protein n=1 Tax=Pseudonocardia sp. GCM10023141 TaxID=3252653 RepID=UPI00361DBC4D
MPHDLLVPRLRSRFRRQVLAAAVAVLAAAGVSACADDGGGGGGTASSGDTEFANLGKVIPGLDKAVVAAACQEGQLQLYQINVTPSANDVVDSFKQMVPCVKLNVVQASGAELAQRFTTGRRTGDVPDYFENSDPGILSQLAGSGAFQQYQPPGITDLASPNPGLWFPEYNIAMGFLYRPDRLSDAQVAKLATWKGVLDPTFANTKMAVISPAAGGTPLVSFYDMVTTNGKAFVSDLKSDKITVFPASRPAGESIASGESDMAWPFASTTALELLGHSAPVRIVFPTPVDLIPVGSGIPTGAKHPNAAKLFISYMLSDAVQKQYSQKNGAVPARSSVPFTNDVTNQPWWKLPTEPYGYQPAEVSAAAPDLIAGFKSAFGG